MKAHTLQLLVGWTSLVLLTGASHLFAQGAPIDDPILEALERLDARLDQFDERLQRLEGDQSTATAEISEAEGYEGAALERTVEALRRQLARLERQIATDRPDLDAKPSPRTVLASQNGRNASDAEISVPSPDEVLFHPSRGWVGDLHYGAQGAKIDLHAFVDLEYIDSGPDGSRGGVSTFDNHHANIFFRSWLRPNLMAHIEVEYEHSGDVVEIDQAFASWRIDPAFNLDAGRFYTPFGIERFVQFSPVNALVSRPQAMRQIIPGNFYANGIRAWGLLGSEQESSSRWTYDLAVSDGLGDEALENRRGSRQTRDNNSNRALTGRLAYTYWPYFEVGSSYHTQRYSTDGDLDISFLGVDLSGRWQGWDFRAEWVQSEVDRSGLPALEEDGWYFQAAYTLGWERELFPELGLVARIDQVDLDSFASGNDEQDYVSLGLNFKIYDHFRFKTEYQFKDEEGPDRDDDTFYMQFVIDF